MRNRVVIWFAHESVAIGVYIDILKYLFTLEALRHLLERLIPVSCRELLTAGIWIENVHPMHSLNCEDNVHNWICRVHDRSLPEARDETGLFRVKILCNFQSIWRPLLGTLEEVYGFPNLLPDRACSDEFGLNHSSIVPVAFWVEISHILSFIFFIY